MTEDDLTPWAPPASSSENERFRPGRVLCDDGFCLGVLRDSDHGSSPYRAAAEVICPVCGRGQPRASLAGDRIAEEA